MLDKWLPVYDHRAIYSRLINASPEACYKALDSIDLSDSFLIRLLFLLRGLKAGPARNLSNNFVLLQEEPSQEIILGLIGQPWKSSGGLIIFEAAEFASFKQPDYAKMLWNFRFEPVDEKTLVSTETRIYCTDEASRKKFSRYWWIVAPFSGLVRKEMLRLLEQKVIK